MRRAVLQSIVHTIHPGASGDVSGVPASWSFGNVMAPRWLLAGWRTKRSQRNDLRHTLDGPPVLTLSQLAGWADGLAGLLSRVLSACLAESCRGELRGWTRTRRRASPLFMGVSGAMLTELTGALEIQSRGGGGGEIG
ncbi:hypothetical protein THAOC_12114 [Thalassiosira oceanica]|uniref:Uncharacterized protein n=1 Tax=Thalassiosira oceanica TaxID=159749 RepID=K0SNG4_THAOC|nr:hypothetical protein THAOC_12114 [Thalassiosira oceanica]|eukprot:EJK66915.1 hypothetical protein THAOC_12114 [Thalassiosira oceanica]